jgi:hypothetical protein
MVCIALSIIWIQGGFMSTVQTSATPQQDKPRRKIPFTMPQIRSLGTIIGRTRQGGSSKEYDSYSENRS